MNLIETERLVRRMIDVLQQHSNDPQAAKMAQDYADQCRLANHRLEQCATMLQAGDDLQALQLAEVQPSLLDLVSILGFRQLPDWRSYCQTKGYAAPETPDPKFIRQLNAAYAKGISADHQLYHHYRQAVLRNQDDQALSALNVITRLNPGDANAARELERLQTKIVNQKLERLRQALDSSVADAVVATIADIESLPFPAAPPPDLWRRAQTIRCQVLMQSIQPLRNRDAWQETSGVLDTIQDLVSAHGLELAPVFTQAFADARDWVAKRWAAWEEDQQYAQATQDLSRLLDQADTKQVGTRRASLADLRKDFELLSRKWREIEQFSRLVPEGMGERVRKHTQLLRSQIVRRQRARRNTVILTVTVLLVIAVGASLRYQNQRLTEALAAEVNQLVSNREVSQLEKRLASLRETNPRQAKSPPLQAALEKAASYLEKEQRQLHAFEEQMLQLSNRLAQASASVPAEALLAQLQEATRLGNALPNDYQSHVQATLLTFQNRWEAALDRLKQANTAQFLAQLQEAEKLAGSELSYAKGPAALRANLSALAPRLASLESLATPRLEQLRVEPSLRQRLALLQTRATACSNQVVQTETIEAALQSPASLDAYLAALRLLQQSEFASPVQTKAAGEIVALNVSAGTMLSTFLAPGNPAALSRLTNAADVTFHPERPMPAEQQELARLRDDENIRGLLRHKVRKRVQPPAPPYVLYSRGGIRRNQYGRMEGLVYDPSLMRVTAMFQTNAYDPSDYEFLEDLGPTPEGAVFERVGLKDLVDGGTGRYTKSLLEILDELGRDTATSPVFRAYLMRKLQEIVALRPADWGCLWAPAVALHQQKLRDLGADTLASGDWLVLDKNRDLGPKFESFFAEVRPVSYVQQATFFRKLLQRAVDAGFVFAGYVDATGKPVLVPQVPRRSNLWGWRQEDRSPALLFAEEDSSSPNPARPTPLPFTPLFTLGAKPQELLAAVTSSFSPPPADAAIKPYLPPLFRGSP